MKSITKRKTNGEKKISERCKTYPRFFLIDVHSCCESSIRMSFLRRVSTTSRSYSVRCGVTRCMSAAILDAYGGGCKQQPFSSCSLSLSLAGDFQLFEVYLFPRLGTLISMITRSYKKLFITIAAAFYLKAPKLVTVLFL